MASRPWSAYGLRILCSALMFGSGYVLLAQSTFALRLREDAPVGVLVAGVAAFLAFLPLAFGRRYLGALIVSGFLLSGLGGYWWTTIPWDELIKESEFGLTTRPTLTDYALVASPAIVCAFYAAISRPSTLRADLKNRGADDDEIVRAASASFLSGATLLVACGALAALLWLLMANGLVFRAIAPLPVGVPALIVVAALVVVAYALLARRLPRFRLERPSRPPTTEAARAGLLARIKAVRRAVRG